MRIRHTLFFSLLLCGAFMFRLYALGIAIPASYAPVARSYGGFTAKQLDNQSRRRALKVGFIETGRNILSQKIFKKTKGVRTKKWRLPSLPFLRYLQDFLLQASDRHLSDSFQLTDKLALFNQRRYLALSVIRI